MSAGISGSNTVFKAATISALRRSVSSGDSAEFVLLFCRYGAVAWVFITCLFVANTAFNNLGFALMAMLFNWGRATLGTIPFVVYGAKIAGVPGAMTGLVCGATIFGLGSVATAYYLVARLARSAKPG